MTLPTERRERLSDATIRNSYREQGQLCQARRWLAVCQRAEQPAATVLAELFTDDVVLQVDNVASEPVNLLNIATLRVARLDASLAAAGGELTIQGDALSFSDNPARCVRARLALTFAHNDELLPKIRKIQIETGVAVPQPEALADPAAPHRILALKHRWHALGEAPVKAAPPYQTIITDNFCMDWGVGSVNSYPELEAWLANTASRMAAARHDIAGFDWHATGVSEYQAVFKFDWSGIALDGAPMQAHSRHTWSVRDNRAEPFARIERMQVELLVPFHVVEAGQD